MCPTPPARVSSSSEESVEIAAEVGRDGIVVNQNGHDQRLADAYRPTPTRAVVHVPRALTFPPPVPPSQVGRSHSVPVNIDTNMARPISPTAFHRYVGRGGRRRHARNSPDAQQLIPRRQTPQQFQMLWNAMNPFGHLWRFFSKIFKYTVPIMTILYFWRGSTSTVAEIKAENDELKRKISDLDFEVLENRAEIHVLKQEKEDIKKRLERAMIEISMIKKAENDRGFRFGRYKSARMTKRSAAVSPIIITTSGPSTVTVENNPFHPPAGGWTDETRRRMFEHVRHLHRNDLNARDDTDDAIFADTEYESADA